MQGGLVKTNVDRVVWLNQQHPFTKGAPPLGVLQRRVPSMLQAQRQALEFPG